MNDRQERVVNINTTPTNDEINAMKVQKTATTLGIFVTLGPWSVISTLVGGPAAEEGRRTRIPMAIMLKMREMVYAIDVGDETLTDIQPRVTANPMWAWIVRK